MEIIIGIIFVVLVGLIFFSRKSKAITVTEAASYKVETPEPVVKTPAPVVAEPEVAPEVGTAPAKKSRKQRAPKAEKPAAKKAPAKATARKPKAK
jgi:hypothetical protein